MRRLRTRMTLGQKQEWAWSRWMSKVGWLGLGRCRRVGTPCVTPPLPATLRPQPNSPHPNTTQLTPTHPTHLGHRRG